VISYGFIFYKSNAQCGSGGMIVGNSYDGFYCVFASNCDNCQNSSQCPDCPSLCESKGKIKSEGFCGPSAIYCGLNRIDDKMKRDEEGNIYSDKGIHCVCCCDEKE